MASASQAVPTSSAEDEVIAALLAQMNTSLDEAQASIRSARATIRENLARIDAMQEHRAASTEDRA
jgi:hypothetical protein